MSTLLPTQNSNNSDNLSEMSLIELTEKLSRGGELSTAKVIIPNEDQLTIKLVNVNLIKRLDELKEDENIYQNYFFTVIGTLLGTIISVLMSDKPISETGAVTITIIVFLIMIAFFLFGLKIRIKKRLQNIKLQIFGENENEV